MPVIISPTDFYKVFLECKGVIVWILFSFKKKIDHERIMHLTFPLPIPAIYFIYTCSFNQYCSQFTEGEVSSLYVSLPFFDVSHPQYSRVHNKWTHARTRAHMLD